MIAPGRIGFVTGLVAEARWLRRHGFMVGIGGGLPAGAARAAERLLDQGAEALISFGLAGGLDPRLRPGDLLIPGALLADGRSLSCDPSLLRWLGGNTVGVMTSAPEVVATTPAKAALYAATGAAAVDLESGAMAQAAVVRGIPVAALRAVADPAARNLPPAALVALDSAGAIALQKVLLSMMRRPAQIPALLDLARYTQRARATLRARLRDLARAEKMAAID